MNRRNVNDVYARGFNAEGIYDSLLVSIGRRVGYSEEVPPLNDWAKQVFLDGKPFTFDRHEYLVEPYLDTHPFQVEQKAAQDRPSE